MATHQVIESGGADELTVCPGNDRFLTVVAEQVEGKDVDDGRNIRVFNLQLFEEQGVEIGQLAIDCLGKDRGKMFLLIDSPVFVGFPVKVDGDAGNGQQRSAKIDQQGGQVSVAHPAADPASQGEISIEPGGKQTPPVNLDPELQVRTGFDCSTWFDLQAGAIGVGSEQSESLGQLLRAAQGEGDNRAVVSYEKIGLSLNELPRLVFPELYKALGV